MKRRVLCIFVLILWGLVFCTMLSVRIEQLMIPEVVLTQADESEPSPHIALDSLFFDDTGMHLYRPREGSGWETGTRIYEEEINNYSVGENQLDLKFFGSYVRYASKPLRSGDEISIKSDLENRDDTWLAIFPEGIPQLSGALTPTAEAENALLFNVTDTPQPFMADRAKSTILPVTELANENADDRRYQRQNQNPRHQRYAALRLTHAQTPLDRRALLLLYDEEIEQQHQNRQCRKQSCREQNDRHVPHIE